MITISFLYRAYEQLAMTAEDTKANFVAYERNDLKLREVNGTIID